MTNAHEFCGSLRRVSFCGEERQESTNPWVPQAAIGGATGRGAGFIVIDDPHALSDAYSKVELENAVKYVRQTLFSRLDDPKRGAIVLIQQRLHENDLAGDC